MQPPLSLRREVRIPVVFVLVALLVAGAASAQQVPPILAPRQHVGELGTVCGVVVRVACRAEDRGGVRLLLDGPYGKDDISLAISSPDGPALRAHLDRLLLQPVCGTGKIEKHKKAILVRTTPDAVVPNGPREELPPGFRDGVYTVCDDGLSLPTLVREVEPSYPTRAMNARKQGTVLVNAIVLPDGRVGDVVVAVSADKTDGLDDAAVAAARQWLFKPGTLAGRAVPVVVSIELAFKLNR